MEADQPRLRKALFALCACYPVMPVAFVCGFGIRNNSPSLIVTALFYVLLLTSLWRCARYTPRGRVAFGAALGAVLVHLGYVGLLIDTMSDRYISPVVMCIPVVAACVGVAAAQLALFLGERVLSALLVAGTLVAFLVLSYLCRLVTVDVLPGRYPEWFAMGAFYAQGFFLLLCACRLKPKPALAPDAPGLNPA